MFVLAPFPLRGRILSVRPPAHRQAYAVSSETQHQDYAAQYRRTILGVYSYIVARDVSIYPPKVFFGGFLLHQLYGLEETEDGGLEF